MVKELILKFSSDLIEFNPILIHKLQLHFS